MKILLHIQQHQHRQKKLEKEWHFGFYLDRIKYLLIGSLTNGSVVRNLNKWCKIHYLYVMSHICFVKSSKIGIDCCSVRMQISWLFCVCKQKIINTSCKNYARARGIKYNNDRHFISIPKAENVSLNTVYYWLQKVKTH